MALTEGVLGLVFFLMVGLRAESVSCFLAADGDGVVAVELTASIFLFIGLPTSSLAVAQGAVADGSFLIVDVDGDTACEVVGVAPEVFTVFSDVG